MGQSKQKSAIILQVEASWQYKCACTHTVEHVHNNDRALSTLLPFVVLAFVPLSCRLLGLAPLMPMRLDFVSHQQG